VRGAGPRRRARSPRPVAAALLGATAVLASLLGASASLARVPSRRPQVFLLASAPDSLADLKRHARSVGIVYPTFYDCERPSGSITGSAQAAVGSYAQAQGLRVMPRFNCQDGATVHTILTDPLRRAATLAALASIAVQGSNRGVCLDLENDVGADREAMSSFVRTLAAMLHARHRRLTVVVVGLRGEEPARQGAFYDYRAISAAADHVFVLAWGTHWAGSGPGPIASLEYVRAVVGYVASLPNASRFAIGAPMYALDWRAGEGEVPASAAASQYTDVVSLARRVGAKPRRDPASQELTFGYRGPEGAEHVVWYMDSGAVDSVLRIAEEAGLSIGLWRLGLEDQRVWSAGVVA